MDIFRIIVIVLNFIIVGVLLYLVYEEGLPSKGMDLIFYVFLLTPILTLYYILIYRYKNDEESLFSLWLKLKKKNIKDELEK